MVQVQARRVNSYLSQVFCGTGDLKWEFVRLEEAGAHSLGKMLDKSKNRGSFHRYLRNLNVRWFSFDLEDLLEMRFEKQELAKYALKKGDLMICEGGYPGRSAVWEQDDEMYFQKALHRVRFQDESLAKLTMFYLFMQDATGMLKKEFSGTGIQHFTGQVLRKFRIPTARRDIVASVVGRIQEVRKALVSVESIAAQKIGLLKALKMAILESAFTPHA